jgi:RNA polymerase sigma-70 factor (ECF subfamily)
LAYDELVRRYQERIYATVYHMTANHEDANDLAQESFIKAFRALKSRSLSAFDLRDS